MSNGILTAGGISENHSKRTKYKFVEILRSGPCFNLTAAIIEDSMLKDRIGATFFQPRLQPTFCTNVNHTRWQQAFPRNTFRIFPHQDLVIMQVTKTFPSQANATGSQDSSTTHQFLLRSFGRRQPWIPLLFARSLTLLLYSGQNL